MKVKKALTILLALFMSVAIMTGCQSSTSNNNTADNQNETEDKQSDDNSETVNGERKTLVVYYSASGNTKEVALKIAEITGGDLFEIEPLEPYTSDDLNWSNNDSRVSKEHDDESLRDVKLVSTTVDDWESYDTVYIGYPIWWGIAAWPVNNFVKDNDFTGKTVIPFCTAASSGIGDSGKLLEELTNTGKWKDGERFHGNSSESDIRAWIESL